VPLRRPQLARALSQLEGFPRPWAPAEQVTTPPEAAVELLFDALARDDLAHRSVLDLGSGAGHLAIGAALLGARRVVGVERDPAAIAVARSNADSVGANCEWIESSVSDFDEPFDTVVMNPPFGAQQKHADAPFWERALALARRAVYAFSLADSRNFIGRQAVARAARIETTRPVRWELPATFPHHRKPRVPLAVDLWVLRTENASR
jgi:putative methylase